MEKLKTYYAQHSHKHGTDIYFFKSKKNVTGYYYKNSTEENIKIAQKICEFTPTENESLNVLEVKIKEIPTIKF